MKKDKISELYTQFEKDYQGKSKEEMDKIVSDLEKEIAGKEASLEGKEGDIRENISKDIEDKKKKLKNIKGYTKNKEQIEKIRKFKETLEKKLKTTEKTKADSKKKLDTVAAKLSKVESKLSDEKYTMKLDQDQYNDLLKQKANYSKDVATYSKQYCSARDRVEELKIKISKCNLAWRTLFVDKDWDDIQRIATTDKQRFTRKITDEQEPISEKKKAAPEKVAETAMNAAEREVREEISKSVNKFLDDKQEQSDSESTDLVPVKKENFFKRIWNKFKNFVIGQETVEKIQEKEENVEEKNPVITERDTFLEGLRKHVDVEYREGTKAEKEAKEKEAHRVRKTNKDDEREI